MSPTSISESHLRRVIRDFLLSEGKEMLFSASSQTCPHCGGRVDDSGECEKCGDDCDAADGVIDRRDFAVS